MKKIAKQAYTAEFRELAVKRVIKGRTPGVAAKELGVNHQTLWVATIQNCHTILLAHLR